jgi:hypothetical protein
MISLLKCNHKAVIKAKTYDNPFLPDGYVDTLKENHNKVDAYLNGELLT